MYSSTHNQPPRQISPRSHLRQQQQQQVQSYLNQQSHQTQHQHHHRHLLSAPATLPPPPPPPPVGSADWVFNPVTLSWMGRAEYEAGTCAAAAALHGGYPPPLGLPAAGGSLFQSGAADATIPHPSAAVYSATPSRFFKPQPQPQPSSSGCQGLTAAAQQWHGQILERSERDALSRKMSSNAITITATSQPPPPLPMTVATPKKDVTPWPTFTPGKDSHISGESNPFGSKPKAQPKPKATPVREVFLPPDGEGYDHKLERWKDMGDDEFVMVVMAKDKK